MKFCTLQPVLLAVALALGITTSALPVGEKAAQLSLRSEFEPSSTALIGREAESVAQRSVSDQIAGFKREEAFEDLYTRWDDEELFERTPEEEMYLVERTAYPPANALEERFFFLGKALKKVVSPILGSRSLDVEERSFDEEQELVQRNFFKKMFGGIKKAFGAVGKVVKGVAGKVLGGRSIEADENLDARSEHEISARATNVEFY